VGKAGERMGAVIDQARAGCQVTPHLARYARHPLPKGEGCSFGSNCFGGHSSYRGRVGKCKSFSARLKPALPTHTRHFPSHYLD